MTQASAFDRAVRIGADPAVHIASGYYHNETRCGLGGVQAPDLRPTTDFPTCERCIKSRAA